MNLDIRIRVTLDRIAKFEESIADARAGSRPDDADPILWHAQIGGMESMLESLRREYSELLMIRP
jgi:hypothetical protein